MILTHKFSKDFEKQLYSCGVRYTDVMSRAESLDLESSIETIKPEIPRLIQKSVSITKQLKIAEHLLETAEKCRGVYCVSSFPSDERAKYVATSIIANILQRKAKSKKAISRPYWHRVYGGFKDEIRDKMIEKPSLLVISNVDCQNNSSIKIEKVRDILEKYEGVPRLVVLAGGDPLSFFGSVLHYPLRAGFMMGPPNRIREV